MKKFNSLLKNTALPVIGAGIICTFLVYQADSLEKVKSYAAAMLGLYLGWVLFSIICVFLNINAKDKAH